MTSLAAWHQARSSVNLLTVKEIISGLSMMLIDKAKNPAIAHGDVCAMFH